MSGAGIRTMLSRLEVLNQELGPDANVEEDNSGLDEFERSKKRCALLVAKTRQAIADRNDVRSSGPRDAHAVKLSHEARQALQQLQSEAKVLSSIQAREVKKASNKSFFQESSKLSTDEMRQRNDTLDLILEHVRECESFEKGATRSSTSRSGTRASDEGSRTALLAQPRMQYSSPLQTDLDVIDPEVQSQLQQIRERDQQMDQSLDYIYRGVAKLKGIAVDMNEEIKTQAVMVDELDDKISSTHAALNNLNVKLKETIEQAGGAQRILVNAILLIILVAVGLYLFETFK